MNILGMIFMTIFLDLIGFGLIIPIQPFYVQSFSISPSYITLLSAVYSGMQLLASPILGRWSDQVGRKPVILVSISMMVVGYACFAQAETWWGLVLARALSGLGAGNLGVAQAMVSDLSDESNRTRNMGLIGVAFGLGFILGPALGGLLGQYTLTLPIYVAMCLSILNGLLVYYFLPSDLSAYSAANHDTAQHKNHTDGPIEKPSPPEASNWLYLPLVRSILASTFVFACMFTLMEQCIGFYIEKNWILSGDPHVSLDTISIEQAKQAAKLTAYFLISVGLTAIWVQGFLIKSVSKKYANQTLILAGLSFVSLALFLIPQVTSDYSFYYLLLVAVIMSHGTGLLHPSRSSLLSARTPKHLQGRVFGWYHSCSAFGRMIGPSIAGVLFEWKASSPFYLASISLLGLALYLAWQFKRDQRMMHNSAI